jgi:hypothetical protein
MCGATSRRGTTRRGNNFSSAGELPESAMSASLRVPVCELRGLEKFLSGRSLERYDRLRDTDPPALEAFARFG